MCATSQANPMDKFKYSDSMFRPSNFFHDIIAQKTPANDKLHLATPTGWNDDSKVLHVRPQPELRSLNDFSTFDESAFDPCK